MAHHSQHGEGKVPAFVGGAGQSVVELCRSSQSGLVFWSRQRFEIGAELQIRIRRDALACAVMQVLHGVGGEWVTLRGFVVECPSVRRADGSHGFLVSLLLDQAMKSPEQGNARAKPSCPRLCTRLPGLLNLGLN